MVEVQLAAIRLLGTCWVKFLCMFSPKRVVSQLVTQNCQRECESCNTSQGLVTTHCTTFRLCDDVFSGDLKHCHNPSPGTNRNTRPATFGVGSCPTVACPHPLVQGEASRSNKASRIAVSRSTLDGFWELV